jgi:hypothetical protein
MTTKTTAKTGKIERERVLPPFVARARQFLLARLWFVHPPVVLQVALTPMNALAALKTAASPSTERLHLRNVFAYGRRYYIQPHKSGGFVMTTNAKVSWRYAHRTAAITIMTGHLSAESDLTRVELHSRPKISYLLDVLWLPTFITSLIVVMPWDARLVGVIIAALYSLSWLGHRYNAALEAYEMIFFVEKAFEDYQPQIAPLLASEGAHVVYDRQRDFAAAWEQFYQDVVHQDNTTAREETDV